jgi:hypothetical protein
MGFFFRINFFKGAEVGETLLIHSDRGLDLIRKYINPSLFPVQRHTIPDYYKPEPFQTRRH